MGILVMNVCKQQPAGIEVTLANFFGGLFKQYAIAPGYRRAGQLRVFIVAATKQTKQFSFFLLFVGRGGGGDGIARTGSFLQARLNSRIQFGDRSFETIQGRLVKLLRLVVLGTYVVDFGSD